MRRHGARRLLPVPPDAREQLLEQKRQALRALRELQFEHEAGHVSDDDYAELVARYEAEAARVLTELDRLPPVPPRPMPTPAPAAISARGWRHPLVMAAGALALVAFGVALGAGISRHTSPDPTAGLPMPGSRPLASLEPARGTEGAAGATPSNPSRAVSPEMLEGMLRAARTSLAEGRYDEAMAAYTAVLKRQPTNVDALAHRALTLWIGGGDVEQALAGVNEALARDPAYAPALFYQGYMLYRGKHDAAGAIHAWEQFLKVVPTGEDHERVKRLITEAKTKK